MLSKILDSTLLSLETMLTLYNPFVTAELNLNGSNHLKIYRYKIGSEIVTNIEIDIEGLYNNATDGSSTKVLGNQQTGETANQSSQFDGNLPNNQIKLNSSSNTNDDFYNNKLIYAIGNNEIRTITDYVGSTKIATVGNSFTNTADGSYYTIYDSYALPQITTSNYGLITKIEMTCLEEPKDGTSPTPYDIRVGLLVSDTKLNPELGPESSVIIDYDNSTNADIDNLIPSGNNNGKLWYVGETETQSTYSTLFDTGLKTSKLENGYLHFYSSGSEQNASQVSAGKFLIKLYGSTSF